MQRRAYMKQRGVAWGEIQREGFRCACIGEGDNGGVGQVAVYELQRSGNGKGPGEDVGGVQVGGAVGSGEVDAAS